MKATTTATFEQDVLKSNKIVLLDVWAPWCAPCRGMEPIIDAVAEETKSFAEVIKLDAETEMDIVGQLGVSGLPTFLVFKNGKPVGSIIGATSKANLLKLVTQAQ